MSVDRARPARELRSLLKANGELELSLVDVDIPVPGPREVLVRVGASPINPSDLGLLLGPADPSTAVISGPPDNPVVTLRVPDRAMPFLAARVGVSMAVGNEGAGEAVEAGDSAKTLLGKIVGVASGAMYAEYKCVPIEQCLPLPEGTTAAEGASSFINPLTALGMVETMRREGHKALVHTAAASSLGQMLVRLCAADGVPLVNVVRKDDQASLLRDLGAAHVCNTASPAFLAELTDAIAATGATLAFDAIGGGDLAGKILTAMEAALLRSAKSYSRYGSPTHKQVYIYGMLDTGPTQLNRNFGMAWGLGGWLLTPFLMKTEPATVAKLKARVASEIKTTFATSYAKEMSLVELLRGESLALVSGKSTGGKVLITPNRS